MQGLFTTPTPNPSQQNKKKHKKALMETLQRDIAFTIGNEYSLLNESQQEIINDYIISELELLFEEHNFNLTEKDSPCFIIYPKETNNRFIYEYKIPSFPSPNPDDPPQPLPVKNLVNVYFDKECREPILDYYYDQTTKRIFTNFAKNTTDPIYIIYNKLPEINELQAPYMKYLTMRVAELIAMPFTNSINVINDVNKKLIEAKNACINYDTRQKSNIANPFNSFDSIARTTFR